MPIIYARTGPAPKLPLSGRLFALAVALGCLCLLLIAAKLTPSPDGYGSHTEMGFQSCQFLQKTGLPCPGCGMTTSWTWFVRGNMAASLYVQPMGMVLAIIAVLCFWTGLYVAITGRPVYRLLRVLPSRYYYWPLATLAVLAWAWKIFIHLDGLDGWH